MEEAAAQIPVDNANVEAQPPAQPEVPMPEVVPPVPGNPDEELEVIIIAFPLLSLE